MLTKLQKLFEFLSIPLSVSLIGAALLAKADSSLQQEVARYGTRCETLAKNESALEDAELELRAMIDNEVRGKKLLDKHRQVQALKDICFDLHWEIIDDFGHLIKAALVTRPIRRKQNVGL